MQDGGLRGPANDDDRWCFVDFDQLNGQYVDGSDLARGQLGNLTHGISLSGSEVPRPVGSCELRAGRLFVDLD